jgi:hypothetical protein
MRKTIPFSEAGVRGRLSAAMTVWSAVALRDCANGVILSGVSRVST